MVIYSEGSKVESRTPAVLLVVEDDKDMRSLLCDELWGEGYQLREASNGDEGLAAVMRAAPDLIVTDLKMPAGGFDYVHRLRRCVPGCPIIVMTAFGDAQTKDRQQIPAASWLRIRHHAWQYPRPIAAVGVDPRFAMGVHRIRLHPHRDLHGSELRLQAAIGASFRTVPRLASVRRLTPPVRSLGAQIGPTLAHGQSLTPSRVSPIVTVEFRQFRQMRRIRPAER